MQKPNSGTLRAGGWHRATAAWCWALQCSAPGRPGRLGPLTQASQYPVCWMQKCPSTFSQKEKRAKEKVLLNLFLSWGLQAPVARSGGKEGCWAQLGLLAGREMSQSSAPCFVSPGCGFQISQASSPPALLFPGQAPLGTIQKQKYCHHVFILSQRRLLTPCSDWAQGPGCCQSLSYVSSQNCC